MQSTVTKTTSTGTEVVVSWSASADAINADGQSVGHQVQSVCTGVQINLTSGVSIKANSVTALSRKHPGMPTAAAGVIHGHNGTKSVAQPLTAELYDMILQAAAEAQSKAESDTGSQRDYTAGSSEQADKDEQAIYDAMTVNGGSY